MAKDWERKAVVLHGWGCFPGWLQRPYFQLDVGYPQHEKRCGLPPPIDTKQSERLLSGPHLSEGGCDACSEREAHQGAGSHIRPQNAAPLVAHGHREAGHDVGECVNDVRNHARDVEPIGHGKDFTSEVAAVKEHG